MEDTVEDYVSDNVDLVRRSSIDAFVITKKNRITIEPMLFAYIFSIGTVSITIQNFIINAICQRRNLDPNVTHVNCDNLTAYKDAEAEVQVKAVEINMYNTMLNTSLVLFYSLFLGEWIKKNGSKFTMILPLVGFTIGSFYVGYLSTIQYLHIEFFILTAIPVGLTGANLAITISSYSYITRVTSEKSRSFRLAIVQGIFALGIAIGLLVGAEVLKLVGYTAVFVLCGTLDVFALLYVIFFVENDGPELSLSMFKDMCNLKVLKETVGLCFRPRDGSKRMWVLFLYLALAMRTLTQNGLGSVLFLLTRLRFGWSSYDYTDFITADSLISVAGLVILSVVGIKILKLRDTKAGVIGSLSTLVGSIVWVFANAGWMPYMASGIQIFGGSVTILIRSILSKLVDEEEIGTAYVVAGVIDEVIPLISAPLYGLIYEATLTNLSSSVIFVSLGGNMIIFLVFLYLTAVIPEPDPQTNPVINSEPEDEQID